MRRGDVLHHVHPGGGFGDPARVLDDVRNEKVSAEAARRDYGVAIDTSTWTVDEVATARLRGRDRAAGNSAFRARALPAQPILGEVSEGAVDARPRPSE